MYLLLFGIDYSLLPLSSLVHFTLDAAACLIILPLSSLLHFQVVLLSLNTGLRGSDS